MNGCRLGHPVLATAQVCAVGGLGRWPGCRPCGLFWGRARLPGQLPGEPDRYPFTEPERVALQDAYRALTRMGNAAGWDDSLDRAQQAIAMVMVYAGVPLGRQDSG